MVLGSRDREWVFVLDAVIVTYTNRDGKIVAQSVKVNAR
jgi:hypothetical protein